MKRIDTNRGFRLLSALVLSATVSACGDSQPVDVPTADAAPQPADAADAPKTTPFVWDMIPGDLPAPFVPEDNPMTVEGVFLGRHLFYDTRLSGNETQSCATCHEQEKGFADGKVLPLGSTGDTVPRNSPGLMNVAYHTTFTWGHPDLYLLRKQIAIPIFGEFPVELGVTGKDEEVLARFKSDPLYQELFADAFPDDSDPFTFDNITKALASFVRSMVSFDSPYDRYTYKGDTTAMSESALRGLELFFQERIDCHHCHGNMHFSLSLRHENTAFLETGFANNGLYNLNQNGSYPAPNEGLVSFTGRQEDRGKFRSSSLRNVAITGPYMHDGSIETLDDVISMYERGGRFIATGENIGDGKDNPFKSEFVHGFSVTDQERADIKAFLESLTDESFLTDPAFSNPFAE